MPNSTEPSRVNLGPLMPVFYPTFGYRDPAADCWRVAIRGVLRGTRLPNFRQRLMVRVLRRMMDADESQLASDVFRQRVGGFLARGAKNVRLEVVFADDSRVLPHKTRGGGVFSGMLPLGLEEALQLAAEDECGDRWLSYRIANGDATCFPGQGRVQLLAPTGVSVISDIDDTIKHSDVAHRRALLANTFLREFQPVPGMPELFRTWAAQGAAFHYVSSSPWQLYEPLAELFERTGIPLGSFHLRTVRLGNVSVLRLLFSRRWGKRWGIRSILRAFPGRQFVLVGDSGERDPEIYGILARRYARQVQRIYIREIPGRPMTPDRCQQAFRRLPEWKWQTFREPEEIGAQLPGATAEKNVAREMSPTD